MSGNIISREEDVQNSQSIYIHIPFCSKKCPYCHFYVIKDALNERSELQKEALLASLIGELYLIKESLSPSKKIVSIYWGGGTPSLFGPKRIEKFHKKLYDLFPLTISQDIEITLEINPDSASKTLLEEYREAGINRISMGAQSFDDTELSMLGRTHTGERTRQTIEWSQGAGLKNISIDLMYDLPSQTLEMWESNLQTAFSLPITHLSLYNLTIEPKTQFFRIREELEKRRPSDEISREMYLVAQKVAREKQFEQYEISAFAKPNYQSRHNVGYWTGREFYGFGPSAYSFMKGIRFSNSTNINRYMKTIESGLLEHDNIDEVTPEKRIRELFCVGLRLFAGVSLNHLISQYAEFLAADFYTALNDLIDMRYIVKNEDRYLLTEEGRLVYDTVASCLI